VSRLWANLGKIVSGAFTPVLAKHSKNFSLIDALSIGVDRMQRNFGPMQQQIEAWRASQISDVTAKLVIYEAFIEGGLDVPRHLARTGSATGGTSKRPAAPAPTKGLTFGHGKRRKLSPT
jgi:hypothetical protein